ncbi:MAG: ferritin-like domain-containing protein [Gaiellaceae bacterium]
MDRAGFFSSSARGGASVALGAMAAGWLVDNAVGAPAKTAASDPLADLDLAIARLAVGAEILAAEFYTGAIAAKTFSGDVTRYLKRALFNEQEHLTAMSQVLFGAGQAPLTADDLTITFPKGTFDSRGSIAKFGIALETAFLGAYLGAVDALGSSDLKTTAARIAASEAQHLSVFSELTANRPVGVSFPAPIDYATASDLLDGYLS